MSLLRKKKTLRKKDFAVVSGEDALTFSIMALGGTGVISAVANVIPKEIAAMVHAFAAGRIDRARAIQLDLLDIIDVMFIETNPIPAKTACAIMGLCALEFRLPLCEMSSANLVKLKNVLLKHRHAGR